MNSKEKRSEIIELINNIKEHSDRLADRPNMPLLEVSAILSKINKLHESTVVLKYLLAKEQNHEEEFKSDLFISKKYEEEDEEEFDLKKEETEEEEKSISEDSNAELSNEIQLSNEVELIVIEESEIEAVIEEDVSLESDILENIPGLDQLGKIDLNEQYSSTEDDRLEEKLNKMPIVDILPSIGLNERYLYANDLFDGDMELFKKELQKLNDYPTLDEAFTYWEELVRNNDWDEENTLVKALKNLIDRRFSS